MHGTYDDEAQQRPSAARSSNTKAGKARRVFCWKLTHVRIPTEIKFKVGGYFGVRIKCGSARSCMLYGGKATRREAMRLLI
jgi:hypothetical protein